MTTITPPIPGMKVIPYQCPVMTNKAFFGCVHWALSNPEIKQAFKDATGNDLDSLATASPLEQQIDESTGRTHDILTAFCDFVAENVWGVDDADLPRIQ